MKEAQDFLEMLVSEGYSSSDIAAKLNSVGIKYSFDGNKFTIVDGEDMKTADEKPAVGQECPSILSCMSDIVESLTVNGASYRDSKFNSKVYTTCKKQIQHVCDMVGINPEQAVILSAILENRGHHNFDKHDLAGAMGLSYIKLLSFEEPIKDLAERRLINLVKNDVISISNKTVDALAANKPYSIPESKGLSTPELLKEMDGIITERENEHTEFDTMVDDLDALFANNEEAGLVKAAKALGFDCKHTPQRDRVLFYILVWRYIYKDDDNVMWSDFDDFLEDMSEVGCYRADFNDERFQLQKSKVVEPCNEDGMAVPDSFHLTDEVKAKLFAEVGGVRNRNRRTSLKMMSPDDIPARENHARLNPEALAEEGRKLSGEKTVLEQILKQAQVWLTGRRAVIGQGVIDAFTPEQSTLYNASLNASRKYWAAQDKQTEAQGRYDDVFAGFQDHAAAVRATLKEGDTCPVCGNVVKQILTDETIARILKPYRDGIEEAGKAVEAAKKECDDAIVSITNASTAKDGQISAWQGRNAEVTESSRKIMSFVTQLSTLQQRSATKTTIVDTIGRITTVKNKVKNALGVEDPASPVKVENSELESQLGDLNTAIERNATEYSTAEESWKNAKKSVGDFLAANPAFTEDYLVKLSGKSMEDITELDRKVKFVDDMATSANAQKEACKTEREAIAEEIKTKGYVFAEGETSESLEQTVSGLELAISGIDTRRGAIENALKADDAKISNMKKTREEYEKIRPTLTNYETLNSLFGQGGGTLFKKIAQSHLLGVLLENANFYLSQFTDRYELMRQEGSLVVLMKDKQQDEAPRPANTLSGGESFMASLALALGLSSFNSSDFSSDTIFIDEGFGTLSPTCLKNVYETLSSLKKVVGKKVGIISHVEELKEEIHPQIVVEPLGNGLSRINDPA